VLTGSRAHTFTPYTESSTGCPKGWLLSCSSPVSCLRVWLLRWSVYGRTNSTYASLRWGPRAKHFASGRKKLCLVFCITYTFACLCINVPYLPVLLLGRLTAGVSTSILFSVFESWLVSSANSLAIPSSDLSSIFGRATLINGFVAAGTGVVSNQLVSFTRSFASPFIASGGLLVLAYFVIKARWAENYGGRGGITVASVDPFQLRRLAQAWKIVRNGEYRFQWSAYTLTMFVGSTHTCRSYLIGDRLDPDLL
jgi:hypothetical protein